MNEKQPALPHNHGNREENGNMPSYEDFEKLADTLKQLSDPVRMKLFYILCHREECVLNISAEQSGRLPPSEAAPSQRAHHIKKR